VLWHTLKDPSVVPVQRHLLEVLKGMDEAADMVWMLLALKTFSLRNLHFLLATFGRGL